MVTGCNVENASFGLTLCAECGLVSALHATAAAPAAARDADRGAGRRARLAAPVLVAVAVVAGDGDPLLPCGRCRQLLLEAGGPALLVDTAGGPVRSATCCPPPSAAPTCPPAGRRPDRCAAHGPGDLSHSRQPLRDAMPTSYR